jgi:hypothetical protein
MIFLVVTGLAIVAGTTWLVMNHLRRRRLILAMLAASGSIIAGTVLTAVILATAE